MMKATFSIIAEKVCKLLDVEPVLLHSVSNSTVFGIYIDPYETRADSYLCSFVFSAAEPHPGRAQIHIADESDAPALRKEAVTSGTSLLILPKKVDRNEAVSAIYHAFAFYEEWYNNLLQMARDGADWFELLDEGHRVLQNPAILYDRSMRVLAFTRDDGTEDEIWSDTTKSGTARVGTASEADELWKYVSKLDETAEPFRHSGEGMSNPFYNCNIMLRGKRSGMVTVVEYRHPLSPGDVDLLMVFAEVLSFKFRESGLQSSSEAENGQLVQDLLAGAIESKDRLNTRLIAVQWNHAKYFHLMIFYSPLTFITDGQWRQYYEDLSRLNLNGIGCVLHRDRNAICYLLSTQREEIISSVRKMIEAFCTSHRLRCGISNAYENLLDTAHFLTQAIAALRLKPDLMISYEEVRFLRLIDQLKAADYPEDLMHPAVLKLMEIDQESGTDYLPTIAAYIRNGLNQTDTAKALDIHRTTLIYRLRRIAEYTNLDFSDSESLLHAAVSLEMLKD